MTLELDFLPQTAFAFMAIFARTGAMVMTLPGIGDRWVPPRIRLVFALALSLIMLPLVDKLFPPIPATLPAMIGAMSGELLIGIAIGFTVRIIITAVLFAGSVVAFQTGLAFAQSVDPAQGVQSTLFGAFFSVLSVALIFATDLHFLLLSAMHDSYTLFRPGGAFPAGDFLQVALKAIGDSFTVAIQIAAPFLVFGLVFYLGVGILARLIPQVQVFFLAMPANILLGLLLFMLLLSTMMMLFLDHVNVALAPYLA